jgi:tetratricopeptide (TPR) repeat protein
MSLKRRMKRAAEKGLERGDLAFVNGYEITYRPTRDDWYSRLPADAKATIPRLHAAIQEDEPSDATLRELEALVEKHPYAPVFYNYLTVVYSRRDMQAEVERTIDSVLERFPDYIFARLNRAEKLMTAGDSDGALALLGPQLELRGLYPGRKRYHVSEFASYYCMVARYELKRGNRDRAESILDLLWEAAPDDRATVALAEILELPVVTERLAHLRRLLGR